MGRNNVFLGEKGLQAGGRAELSFDSIAGDF